jgi:hypothetical protein
VLVDEVSLLFREYCDEPLGTRLSVQQAQRYLERGYAEFRRRVIEIDPNPYAGLATLVFSDARSYNLEISAVKLLGPNPTQARLVHALSLVEFDSTGSPMRQWAPTQPPVGAAMQQCETFYLLGNTLFLPSRVSLTLTLHYIGEPLVDWSKQTAGDNEYIDDLTTMHDLIALLACKQYAIIDHAMNQGLMAQMNERLADLDQYVRRRSWGAATQVVDLEYGHEYSGRF